MTPIVRPSTSPATPGPCHLTIDVGLLVDLCDAQQVCPLLLATGPGLPPRQSGLEVKLVAAVSQLVLVPEGLTVITCHHDSSLSRCEETPLTETPIPATCCSAL